MVPYGLLIAEDDPSMVRLYKAFLQGVEGVSLLRVTPSGEELLRYFRRGGRAELLLLDIYLEGSNGVDILRELRGMGVDLDVIVVTSESSPRTVGEAMRLGVFDYLVKPFGGSRFRRALEDLVAFRRRIDRVNGRMSQEELDKLLGGGEEELPKGLHRSTLKGMLSLLSSMGEATADRLSEEMGLSKSSVRRYMDYLVREGEVELRLKHLGRGRPVNVYRLPSDL